MFVSSLSECHSDTLCYTYCLNLLCSFSKIYLFVYLVNLSLPVCTCSWWPGDNSFSPASLIEADFLPLCLFYSVFSGVPVQGASRQVSYVFFPSHHGLLALQITDCSRSWFQARIRRLYPLRNPTSPNLFFNLSWNFVSVKDLDFLGRKAC